MVAGENSNTNLEKRLDIIIALLLEQTNNGETQTTRGKILKLHDLGVSSPDISKIIGKPLNYITSTLSQKKAKRGK